MTIGLIAANVLLMLGILPRSFASEMDEGETETERPAKSERGFAAANVGKGKKEEKPPEKAAAGDSGEPLAPPPKLTKSGPAVIAVLLILALVIALWIWGQATAAGLVMLLAAIVIFLIGVLPRDAGQVDVTDEVMEEISHPHVRREMLYEVLFLAIPLAGAAIAYLIPGELPKIPWMARVLGSLLGFFIGGGMIWLVRVGGSLAFGKEAMGIGDAHLMAGVGAVLGAPLVIIAFFLAPFLGILWAIVLKIMGKPNVLPYGPWLAVGSIVALVAGNEIIAWYWAILFGH